jgi:hypothetical protein
MDTRSREISHVFCEEYESASDATTWVPPDVLAEDGREENTGHFSDSGESSGESSATSGHVATWTSGEAVHREIFPDAGIVNNTIEQNPDMSFSNVPDDELDELSMDIASLVALRISRDERMAHMLHARLNMNSEIELDTASVAIRSWRSQTPTALTNLFPRSFIAAPSQSSMEPSHAFLVEVYHLISQLRVAERDAYQIEGEEDKEDEEDEEEVCALCLTRVECNTPHAQLALCRHTFHKTCYDELVRDKTSCPVCRGPSEFVLKPPVGTQVLRRLSQNCRSS